MVHYEEGMSGEGRNWGSFGGPTSLVKGTGTILPLLTTGPISLNKNLLCVLEAISKVDWIMSRTDGRGRTESIPDEVRNT